MEAVLPGKRMQAQFELGELVGGARGQRCLLRVAKAPSLSLHAPANRRDLVQAASNIHQDFVPRASLRDAAT